MGNAIDAGFKKYTATTKKCTICHKDKELDEFAKNDGGLYGVGSYCKTCYNERYSKKYRISHGKRKERYWKNDILETGRDWVAAKEALVKRLSDEI